MIDVIKIRLGQEYGEVEFTERDLVKSNLPHVQPDDIATLFSRSEDFQSSFNTRSMKLIRMH